MRTTHVKQHTRRACYDPTLISKYEHYSRMLAKGTNQEAKEHPTFTLTQVRKIASDHLRENPHYYDKE